MTGIVIRESAGRGRGVFAAKTFGSGDIIEICPVIVLPVGDVARINETCLYNYYFGWGRERKSAGIALGYGSLYNHSYRPNAVYSKNEFDATISFTAIKTILPNEEIFIKYDTGNSDGVGQLWFEVA